MLPEKKLATNIGVGIGIIGIGIGGLLRVVGLSPNGSAAIALIGLIVLLVGEVFFIWGCINYSQGKGYSGAFGLLGLFPVCFIGLLMLVLLPDKHRKA